MDVVEIFPSYIAPIINIKKHLPNYLASDDTVGTPVINEIGEGNNEEGVGESNSDREYALDLEEGFKNTLLGRQSAVGVTTIVSEESGRLPPRTPIDWTAPPVKTQLSEPEFETSDNPGQ